MAGKAPDAKDFTDQRVRRGELAVHPKDAKLVAAATAEGLYLSRDAARSIERLVGKQVLAVSFDLDGEQLWFSSAAST